MRVCFGRFQSIADVIRTCLGPKAMLKVSYKLLKAGTIFNPLMPTPDVNGPNGRDCNDKRRKRHFKRGVVSLPWDTERHSHVPIDPGATPSCQVPA